MASVTFSGIKKSFAGHPVIRNIDINIDDGEFAVLVGPSGCGKSTLLRMLAGLEDVSEGQISIADKVVNSVDSKDRDIAMVFQSYALYPHMTVEENMGFSLLMRKAPPEETRRRVADAARILALDKLLARYPRELSGGQRQRVAMGRAIVRNPKVFLFDEPLSNLDAKLRVSMRAEIKLLHQRLRTTTVYVTHDQVEAMTLADRIVVMNGGIVEQVGRPLDLYDRPANLFVAQFIGSPAMNIMKGRVVESAVGLTFDAEGGAGWPLPSKFNGVLGTQVAYGIRPEHLRMSQGGAANSMPVVVEVVEPTGAFTEVVVKCGVCELTLLINDRTGVRPGDAIFIEPDSQRIHLFEANTGRRIDA
jgi:multiple sugar transport system ATP-binding protein